MLLHEREDSIQGGLLPVDRVDQSLARINFQGGLQGGRVGGIEGKGDVSRLQGRLHGQRQDAYLVHPGRADVDVQNVGSGLHLGPHFLSHERHISGPQRLGQALLARGVDPFADEHRGPVAGDLHRFPGRRKGGDEYLFHRSLLYSVFGKDMARIKASLNSGWAESST